jgi:hypothetical protein
LEEERRIQENIIEQNRIERKRILAVVTLDPSPAAELCEAYYATSILSL